MFDFNLEEGDEQSALSDPMTVVLTRDNAVKYFGTGDAVGKSLTLEWQGEQTDFQVTGILDEVPENSHIHFDTLLSIASYKEEPYSDWRSNYLYTYVMVAENTSKQDLEEKLKTFVSKRLEPGENITSVYLFSCIAVLILIIACLNFVNLSTARASKRAKEVSLRKTVGAEKRQLRVQFIQESMLLAFVSLGLAVVMSSLFIQAYNGIFAGNLSLYVFLHLKQMFIIAGATFTVGVLAGL